MRLIWSAKTVALAVGAFAALFAVFPLTDTDIWWHLACAREWVTTWTPVREPVVNVHEFFQQVVAFVYGIGGAPLLVAFKAVLWGVVFALFLWPSVRNARDCHPGPVEPAPDVFRGRLPLPLKIAVCVLLLFTFRYQLEARPVLFSLLFLGLYWNVLPWILRGGLRDTRLNCCSGLRAGIAFRCFVVIIVLLLQWLWCKCQGLYILGPIFALTVLALEWWNSRSSGRPIPRQSLLWQLAFVALLFAMPFFHREGLNLFLYPFGLLDRLLGLSQSATVFASEIAENRSPITLLMAGENVLQSLLMIVLCVVGFIVAVRKVILERLLGALEFRVLWLLVTAVLALVAERNFVLFLPVFFAVVMPWILRTCGPQNDEMQSVCGPQNDETRSVGGPQNGSGTSPRQVLHSNFVASRLTYVSSLVLIAFLLGLWLRSVSSYDSMVAYQRVPVAAAEWMKSNPHSGRLFNDDRAGGYLSFVNPSDSTYIDGRFILKTAEFFEKYLRYAEAPKTFLDDAKLQNIDRVVLPLRYYARWDKLLASLDSAENWHVAYRDPFFVVMDRTEH